MTQLRRRIVELFMRLAIWRNNRTQQAKSLGERGEEAAVKLLRRKGFRILHRGYREGPGELDIVAADRETVVFVEVKTRRSTHRGLPVEAVDEHKQRQIVHLAQRYRKRHHLLDHPVRFDIVAILWPDDSKPPVVEHFEQAFESPWDD